MGLRDLTFEQPEIERIPDTCKTAEFANRLSRFKVVSNDVPERHAAARGNLGRTRLRSALSATL